MKRPTSTPVCKSAAYASVTGAVTDVVIRSGSDKADVQAQNFLPEMRSIQRQVLRATPLKTIRLFHVEIDPGPMKRSETRHDRNTRRLDIERQHRQYVTSVGLVDVHASRPRWPRSLRRRGPQVDHHDVSARRQIVEASGVQVGGNAHGTAALTGRVLRTSSVVIDPLISPIFRRRPRHVRV